jgi:hypothetical protein
MKTLRGPFIIIFILLYGFLFFVQERRAQFREASLENPMPVSFYMITSGYVRQLAAEMLFIRTSVFLGGVKHAVLQKTYAGILGNNFETMTSLYPQFIDPYYFCQGYLPVLSEEAAKKANAILETGIKAFPKEFVFRFFKATNYMLYLNEPLKSAETYSETAKIPGAPPIFAHLGAVFSAQGGDIAAGLISLKVLLASEKDENVRSHYQNEIAIFEQALKVNEALITYQKKYNAPPDALQQLVPEFIPAIPDIKDTFILVYDKPLLRLQRPKPVR